MSSFWHRFKTGEGQHVDVSMQECVVACNLNTTEMWDLNQVEFTRFSWGVYLGTDKVQSRCVWKCNDGHVVLLAHGGAQVFVNSMKSLVNWMVEEGMADDWLRDFDWETDYDASQLTQDLVNRYESAIAKFLETKTKKELYEEGAIKRRIMTGPLATAKDVWENIQLRSRDFWVNVDHPELGESLTYPGAFIKLSESRMSPRRRAPLIGEHNREIYEKEMGLSIDEMAKLKQTGVI